MRRGFSEIMEKFNPVNQNKRPTNGVCPSLVTTLAFYNKRTYFFKDAYVRLIRCLRRLLLEILHTVEDTHNNPRFHIVLVFRQR